jgi:hypothetical protein
MVSSIFFVYLIWSLTIFFDIVYRDNEEDGENDSDWNEDGNPENEDDEEDIDSEGKKIEDFIKF